MSFCNPVFLAKLGEISAAGRPRCVVWANCMTWTFPEELECHRRGLIDLFVFQSRYQRLWLLPELAAVRPVEELSDYQPFFNVARWSLGLRPCAAPADVGYYGIGRISRDDEAKYPEDLWRTFSRVLSPFPVKCFVLGWGPNAERKCGNPQDYRRLDWMLWGPAVIPARGLLSRVHTLVHQTGGSRENLPRVALEAWASGVAILAEHDYGWPELIEDGESGILCESSDEFAYRASELAFDEAKRRRLVRSGLERLQSLYSSSRRCFAAWNRIL